MNISVLTCVHDQDSAMFAAAARSVAALGSGVEWIVVDDGSAPACAREHHAIATALGPPASRTRFVRLVDNRGLSIARNIALSHATGEWVVVLDSDDELTPVVARVLAWAHAPTVLVSFAAEYFSADPVWSQNRRVGRYASLFEQYGGTPLDPFLWFDFYYHGIVARRAALVAVGGYPVTLGVGEDQDILLRVAEHAGVAGVLFHDEVGYRYRRNPRGVCATRWDDVLRGYTETMAAGARRRGANFTQCRHGGSRLIDEADIDCYEYFDPTRGWLDWTTVTAGIESSSLATARA